MGEKEHDGVEFILQKVVQQNLGDVTMRDKHSKGLSESKERVLTFLCLSSFYLYPKEQIIHTYHIIYIQIGKLGIKGGGA